MKMTMMNRKMRMVLLEEKLIVNEDDIIEGYYYTERDGHTL